MGVGEDADLEEIKRAYYDRARLYHPDAHASSAPAVRAEAERTMQSLNHAWTVLRNAKARQRYDRMIGHPGTESGSERSGPTTSKRRSSRPSSPAVTETNRRPALGVGFQSWFGASVGARRVGGRPQLNLRLTGSSLEPLQGLVPDGLIGLHAEHTSIGDADLRSLIGMASLRYLDLTGTRVTDAGLVHLLGCRDLETLVLWDTAITDGGLALIARFPMLCHLGLGNTSVTDAGLLHLGGLRHLRLVQLSGTAVEGSGLAHLHGLPQLATVSIPWRVRGGHRRRLRSALPREAQVF